MARFTEPSYVKSYLIQHGAATLTADFRGRGTLNVYFIRNDHIAGGSEYPGELAGAHDISETDFQEQSLKFVIGDALLKTYTDERQDWRNYFRGLDDRICGLRIEVAPEKGGTIEIKYPSLIVR